MKQENGKHLGEDKLKEVIDRCLKGEKESFEYIIKSYHKPVFHICLQVTGNAQEAEEAGNEVFMKVFKTLDSYKLEFKFSTWIYKIAYNYCIGIIRKRKREENYLQQQILEIGDLNDCNTPASHHFQKTEQDQLNGMLQTLPVKYRTALMLKYYRDLSYREISEILGMPQNTIASLLLRGKKELRKKMVDRENQRGKL